MVLPVSRRDPADLSQPDIRPPPVSWKITGLHRSKLMIIVFLGPPGAGKGTQCKTLVERYRLKHLSSGDCLRQERRKGTRLGRKAQSFMDSGQLVPDDLIVAMMMKEIKNINGEASVVLDGFPRTLGQARQLDELVEKAGKKIDAVLNLQVDDNELEQRITGRRSCPSCGAAYHIAFNLPESEGLCDADDQSLVQRQDDTPKVVQKRIKTYHQQSAPLIKYYQERGVLHHLDGNANIKRVTSKISWLLDRLAVEHVLKVIFQARPLPPEPKSKRIRDAG
ncbi:adenylate kinase [Planctomycetota bacterium]